MPRCMDEIEKRKKKTAKDTHTLGNNLQLEANRACFRPLEEEVDSSLNATLAKLINHEAKLGPNLTHCHSFKR